MMAPANVSTTSLIATLNSGFAWPAGPIAFSIPTAASLWPGYAAGGEPFRPGYAPPPAEMAPQIRLAMQRWDELIAPALLEVTEPGAQGQLRVAFTHLGNSDGAWGYAYHPTAGSSAVAGDVWIDPSHRGESFAPETYNFQALLHELGHALGLKHPFETPNILAAEYDTHRHTLMSYTQAQDRFVPSFTVTQTSPTSSSIRASYSPVVIAGPQLLDVLAIQAIYGADPTTRAGDTTHSFDPAIASIQTIYDAGGTDTWDLSASTRRSLIDLREGAFSSVNQFSVAAQIEASLAQVGEAWRGFVTSAYSDSRIYTWDDNVSIAYGTIIENLRLGSAGDHAIGNAARNALSGHDGNDTLLGEGGNDSLEGGGGDDSLVGGVGDDTIAGGSSMDTSVFTGARAQYSVTRNAGTGIVTVRDDTAHRDGTDLLQADVETLRFSDGDHLAISFPGAIPVLSLAAVSADKPEGNSGATPFTFTVTRTGDTSGVSSAAWTTTGNGATAADLTGNALPSGTVSFAAGEASAFITVHVAGDTTNEADEGFTVTLAAPSGATLGTASAAGLIRNDDQSAFAISADQAAKAEGTAGDILYMHGFTVSRLGDLSQQGSVAYAVTGSGANPADAADFAWGVFPSATVHFFPGQSTARFLVWVYGDDNREEDEGFAVTLHSPSLGSTITVGSAQGIIANDDEKYIIRGTWGPDTLIGTARSEWFVAGDGNDLLDGGAGDDYMSGGAGNDTFMASAGWDTLVGGGDGDTLVFGPAFATINLSIQLAVGSITFSVAGGGSVTMWGCRTSSGMLAMTA